MNAKKLFKLIRNDKLEAISALTDSEKGSNTLKQIQPNDNVIFSLVKSTASRLNSISDSLRRRI